MVELQLFPLVFNFDICGFDIYGTLVARINRIYRGLLPHKATARPGIFMCFLSIIISKCSLPRKTVFYTVRYPEVMQFIFSIKFNNFFIYLTDTPITA
jgi:hypothetical protein